MIKVCGYIFISFISIVFANPNCTIVTYINEEIACKTDIKYLCSIGFFTPSKITCYLDESYNIWECWSQEGWISDVFIDCDDPCIQECLAYYEPGESMWTLFITFFGILFFVCVLCMFLLVTWSTHCFFQVSSSTPPPIDTGLELGNLVVKTRRKNREQ